MENLAVVGETLMNAVKQTFAGVSQYLPVGPRTHHKTAHKNGIHVSASGITFPSNTYVAPFTEVQVRVQLPREIANGHFVNCRGVVVDCHGINAGSQYEVAVAFLNLPKSVENDLRQAQRTIK